MNNIFVCSGGKCGSNILHNTFINNNYDSIKLRNISDYKLISNDYFTYIFDRIDLSCKNYENIYIIDSYRTPIERKISSFFQHIQGYLPNYNQLSIKEISDFFNTNILLTIEDYHSIDQVMTHYNVPLFNSFDLKKKYNIVKQNNKIFIKILFKDIQNWDKILSNIFKKEINLYNSNLIENKEINNLYKEFKENYKVPKKYINTILVNDTHFKIYNTKSEQTEYINYWLNRSYEEDFYYKYKKLILQKKFYLKK